MQLLEDNDIKLRAIEPEDLDNLYRWENDSTVWEVTNTRVPYSRFQLRNYIAQSSFDIYENGYLRLIIVSKKDNESVGVVDLFDFDNFHSRVALGLFIDKKFQGKGFAYKALKIVENYVFRYLNLHQLYAKIAENNHASRKLFEDDYMKYGILKDWVKNRDSYNDIICYQKISDK